MAQIARPAARLRLVPVVIPSPHRGEPHPDPLVRQTHNYRQNGVSETCKGCRRHWRSVVGDSETGRGGGSISRGKWNYGIQAADV